MYYGRFKLICLMLHCWVAGEFFLQVGGGQMPLFCGGFLGIDALSGAGYRAVYK